MRTELTSIATDTLPLDGAFYLPESEPCGAVILFHGDTMNFYVRLCSGPGTARQVHPLAGDPDHHLASRAGDSHPHALPEPYVTLSSHTAPDVRPFAYRKRQ